MMNFNNAFKEFFSKIIELNKNNTLLKNIIEEDNKFDQNYKTELCKKFQCTGKCPYGHKCKFAHGKEELLLKTQGVNYKKKPCKTFYEKGYCPYGSRCSFQHDERKFSEISFSYFYLQLFLFKQYNFMPSRKEYYSTKINLLNNRLPVFETLRRNKLYKNEKKEISYYIYNNENIDKNNSFSTISNTSNEDNEEKKYDNNIMDIDYLIKNNKFKKIEKEKNDYKMNEKDLTNHINKENISGNIKL